MVLQNFFIVCFCFFINDNPANSLSMGDVSQGNIRHTKVESEYSITKWSLCGSTEQEVFCEVTLEDFIFISNLKPIMVVTTGALQGTSVCTI